MATVGLRDLHVAQIETAGDIETFLKPRFLAKAIKADMSVEVGEGEIRADDGVDILEKEFDKGTLKLNVSDLVPKDIAMLLGQHITKEGIAFAGDKDEPPFVAIGFRAKKAGSNTYRYLWLYRVKFKIPNESFETKSKGFSYKTPEIEGEFVKRDSDGMWKADYTGAPNTLIARGWFDDVVEYEGPETEVDPGDDGY